MGTRRTPGRRRLLTRAEKAAYAELARAATKLRRAQAAATAQNGDPDLIDAPELAARLDLPAAWVRRQAREGRLPSLRFGRRVFFNLPAVIEALREHAQRREPPPP